MSASHLLHEQLTRNLNGVRERITRSAQHSGRSGDGITLVAVTKYFEWPIVRALLEIGQQDFGENRPQQLIERAAQLRSEIDSPQPRWHQIGQLQRNKVRAVLPEAALIHSVDSEKLLERIAQIADETGQTAHVLLQVNTSGEDSKSGFTPDGVRECLEQWEDLPAVSIQGLMTMAPLIEDEAVIRQTFSRLRELRDSLATSNRPLRELSMGMSGDFEVAIEEGATIVRVGSALVAGIEGHE